jgi:hypothetical protein
MTSQNGIKKVSTNVLVAVCTAVLIGILAWSGRTTANTNESVIILENNQQHIQSDIAAIKAGMITKDGLAIELLKLQVPAPKETKDK